jgi:hypothetical protein
MSRLVSRSFRRAAARAAAATRRTRPTIRLRVTNLEDRLTPALVTNTNDSGVGSLRDAITQANASALDDTITFDTAGVFATPQTISLLTALPQFSSTGGALTITGPAAALTVRRDPAAATNFRVFDSVAPTLNLTGFTVSGGNASGGDGGGLQASGTVTLDGMTFTGNTASVNGGAIRVNGSSFLNIKNSTVSGNTATAGDGGGIYFFNGGGLVMNNTTVAGNTAGGTGAGGGGMYWFGSASPTPPAGFTASTVVIKNSTFSNNTTAGNGGGIVTPNLTGTILVQNSTFTNNSAAAVGGGIHLNGAGTLTVQGSTLSGNMAANGGGIGIISGTTLNVLNSTLTGNTATASGGGIGLTGGATVVSIKDSTIAGNTANGSAAGTGGGGIGRTSATAATVTVANSVVSGNTNANGPDILATAVSTVNVNFSAVGSNTGFTLSGSSGNNLAFGANLQLGALADNGGPTKTMLPAGGSPLLDAGSNALIPAGLTKDQRGPGYVRTFNATVDIGAVEAVPLGTPEADAAPADVTTLGATTHTFTVTFSDLTGANRGIDVVSSVVNNNAAVRITGPGGFDAAASYSSIDFNTNGTPRTATYTVGAPGGTWDAADNGVYSVVVQANQVFDLDGNPVPVGTVGSFNANLPVLFTVTNADDAGAGSLRDAITQANALATSDVIAFSPTFFNVPRTISLLSALPQFPAAGGGLTITGPGAALLTVRRDTNNAATQFRIFDSAAPTVSISGLRLSGGNVSGSGGAIQEGGTSALLTLDGVTIDGNIASGTGGGIQVASGNFLNIKNSTVSGNIGSTGGGVYLAGSGSMVMDNVVVSGNLAGTNGGGIAWTGTASATPPTGFMASTVVVKNSTITNNVAGSGVGGGITIPSLTGTFLVQNTTLANNRSATSSGGGINLGGSGALNVFNGTFDGNFAATAGGALNSSSGPITVVGSSLTNNTAITNGGGIAFSAATAALSVQNSTLFGNTAGTSGSGGGIAVTAGTGTITVQNSTIAGNSAGSSAANTGGGGIARTPTTIGTLAIQNSVVAGNTAAAPANGPDVVTGASGSTVNINFSAVGTNTGYAASGTSANNVPPGTPLNLSALANWGGSSRALTPLAGSPLIDSGSNALVPGSLTTDQRGGSFARTSGTVDIGAVEVQGPFLPSATSAPAAVSTGGGTSYTFTVTFADPTGANNGIKTSTLINQNGVVQVTGPNGFSTLATYVGIDNSTDGTPRTVTYSFTPPGGSWDGVDNGLYTVQIVPNQIKDLDDNFVIGGPVGSFQVQTPYVVTNTNDSGPGSFREAIVGSSFNPAAETITFAPAVFATPKTISLLSPLPQIPTGGGALTVTGPGANLLTIRRDPAAATSFRLIDTAAPSLTLTGLRLTGGSSSSGGGAINQSGTATLLSLDGVTLDGNSTTSFGGAILVGSGDFLSVKNSTVTGNSATSTGGGIYFFNGGGLVMDNTTVAGNKSATTGGGLTWFGTAATTGLPAGFTAAVPVIANSTFDANTAVTSGGAINIISLGSTTTFLVLNDSMVGNTATGATATGGAINVTSGSGTLAVVNTTLAGNTAVSSGGGLAVIAGTTATSILDTTIVGNTSNASAAGTGGGGLARTSTVAGTVAIQNSVVAGNTNANGPDVLATAVSTVNVNYSAVGNNTGFNPSGTSGNNLPAGTDLKLAPLANWGGPTRSVSLLPNSPLIDAGSNALVPNSPPLTTDQRGGAFARIAGTVDIGAVEAQAPFLPIAVATATPVTTVGASYTFTVTFSDPTGTNNGIKAASLIGNNAAVQVSGPNGFSTPATYVSIDNSADGTPRTVTYSITPPGGSWDVGDNGLYSIRVAANQVKDLDDNFVIAGPVGSFAVAAPYVVTNANDSGAGSLRDVLTKANADPANDAIIFDPTVFGTPRTIGLATALPQIPAAGGGLTISGPGANLLTVRRDGAVATTNFRILDSLSTNLTVSGVRLTGGNPAGAGGAILHNGAAGSLLTLDGVVIDGNLAGGGNGNGTSGGNGGGVYVGGSDFLSIRNSTVSGNSAQGDGGGLYFFSGGGLVVDGVNVTGNTSAGAVGGGGLYWFGTVSTTGLPAGFPSGTVVIRNSTFANNAATAAAGGGIVIPSLTGTVVVQNTTMSGNTTTASGGAIGITATSGTVKVQDSTLVGNTATTSGGGIARTSTSAGTVNIDNSVVAGNTAPSGPDIVTGSSGTTLTINTSAVGDTFGLTFTGLNNIPAGTDLKLGPLGDNGGTTFTIAPQPTSPLIDAGNPSTVPPELTGDQRGGPFVRNFGTTVDIGAFEVQPPSVTINQAAGQPDPTNSPVQFTVVFNAAVTGFDASDVLFTGSTVSGTPTAHVTGSGRTYTVTVDGMTGDGNLVASIPANAALDGSQTANTASTSTDNTVHFDDVKPTAAIAPAGGQASPTNASPVSFTVHFNEAVTGLTPAGIDLTASTVGGTLVAAVAGSGQDYTVTVSGMNGTGTVVAKVKAGAAADAAGNGNTVSGNATVTFDNDKPTVTINQTSGQADPTNASPVTFTVHFNEPVTGFGSSGIDLTGSSLSGLSAAVAGSGQDYTVTVTGMSGTGTVVAKVKAGAATDAAGNTNVASTSSDNTVTFDNVSPTATVEQQVGQTDPTNGAQIKFDLHFSEPIKDSTLTNADIDLTGSSLTGLSAAVTGSGQDWVITVTGMNGTGDVIARLPAGVVTDPAGNANVVSTSTDNTVHFDNDRPTVTVNRAGAQADPTNSSPVNFAVHFSEPVTGFNSADVDLAGSSLSGLVAAVSGSGADYTITVTGMSGDGTVVARIPAGAAQDATGNINTLSSGTNSVHYDDVVPTVTIAPTAGQADPTNGSVVFDVHFSEPVTGFDATDVDLTGSGLSGLSAGVTGGGQDYTVTVTGMSGTGTVTAAIAAGAAQDAAGNQSGAAPTAATVNFDNDAPTVTIAKAGGQADPTNAGPVTFDVHFSEPVTGFNEADVDLTGSSLTGLSAAVSGSGADYTVTVTGMTGVGTVVARIPAGAAQDATGNQSDATPADASVGFDEVAPTVTITQAAGQADPTAVASIKFDIHFSEPVSGFDASDVSLSGTAPGTMSAAVSGSGQDYQVTVTGMTGPGTVVADIAAAAAQDAAGNDNAPYSGGGDNSVLFDHIGTLQFSDPTYSVTETGGQVTITVTRTGGSANAVTVDYATGGGTAADGSDYSGATGTLNWANGETGSKTFTIPILDDTLVEGSETVGLTLSNPTGGATLGTPFTAMLTIADVEEGVLEFQSPTFTTGEDGVTTAKVFVTRAAGTDGTVTVHYTTSDGTAHNGSDYTATAGTLTWADGDFDPKEIDVPITDDTANEGRETIGLTLDTPTGNSRLGVTTAATLTIKPSDGKSDVKGVATFTDEDGDLVTIRVARGRGETSTMKLYLTDPDGDGKGPLELIELNGSTVKTGITVTVKKPKGGTGNAHVTIGEVTGQDLKSFSARGDDLIGPGITLTGHLGAVTVGDIKNGADITSGPAAVGSKMKTTITAGVIEDGTTIDVGTPLAKLTAIAVGDGLVKAPSIGTILAKGKPAVRGVGGIAGDFKSDVTVTAPFDPKLKGLAALTAKGAIKGAVISVPGNVGTVSALTFEDSSLLAGYTGPADGIGGTFNFPATVTSFKVTGKSNAFSQSFLVGTTFKNVTLASAQTDNGGTSFGVIADGSARVSLTAAKKTVTVSAPGEQVLGGDLKVKIV